MVLYNQITEDVYYDYFLVEMKRTALRHRAISVSFSYACKYKIAITIHIITLDNLDLGIENSFC